MLVPVASTNSPAAFADHPEVAITTVEVSPPIKSLMPVRSSWSDGVPHFVITSDDSIIYSGGQLTKILSDGTIQSISITLPTSPNQISIGDFALDVDDNIYLIARSRINGGDYPFVLKYSPTGMKLFEFGLNDVNGNPMMIFGFKKILVNDSGDVFGLDTSKLNPEIYVYNEIGILQKIISFPNMRSMYTFELDSSDNLYFSGQRIDNDAGIWRLSPNGIETKLISTTATNIEIDSNGNIYSSPNPNTSDKTTSKFDPNGNLLFTFDESKINANNKKIKEIVINSKGIPHALIRDNIVVFHNKFVEDKIPPVIQPVLNILKEPATSSGTSVTFSTTANDAIDGSMPVTCSPLSGTTFPIGKTPVTCTAKDFSSNTSFIKFNVEVKDTTPPIISNLKDIQMGTSTDSTRIGYAMPIASDISGTSTLTCTPASNSLFPIGNTTVTCTATDKYQNSANASFIVSVSKTITQISSALIQDPIIVAE